MSEQNSLVSVIVPTRNRSHCLHSSVGSILAQDYTNLEVIIVNDGSTDGTAKVAGDLAAADPRIRVFEQTGQGQSAAVNRGLDEAAGTIAIMLSDDDILYPQCVSSILPPFEEDESVVVVTGEFDLIDWDDQVIEANCSPEIHLKTLVADHLVNHGVGAAFRIDNAKKAGGWNPRYRHVPDLDFWLRMGLQGEFRYIPRKLGGWRQHPEQLSAHTREGSLECAEEHLQCVDEFLAREDLPDEIRALASQARASAFITAAVVVDPNHIESDRRFFILDRLSAELDSEGRVSDHEDTVRRFAEIAEQRLQVIHSLEAVAEERLELIESLQGKIKKAVERRRALRRSIADSGPKRQANRSRGWKRLRSLFSK